jgi:hypothetical protein
MPGDQAVPLKVDGVVPAEPGLGTSARAIFITSAFLSSLRLARSDTETVVGIGRSSGLMAHQAS